MISQLDKEVLLSWITGKSRAWHKAHPEHKLSLRDSLRYQYALWKRKRHIPIAYIIGSKEWSGFRVKVNKHTLIPRDETEVLCDMILHSKRNFIPSSVLDIGTGSGVIACFCAKNFGEAMVTALDISKPALKIAEQNARTHDLEIFFRYSDLLSQIRQGSIYDIIIANLPYVPSKMEVSKDLDYEPDTALYSGEDGLIHIRQLAQELEEKEIQFKELWLEFLPQQAEFIEQIFSSKWKVGLKKDLSGQIFFACITKA